jgi:hypothetical protein
MEFCRMPVILTLRRWARGARVQTGLLRTGAFAGILLAALIVSTAAPAAPRPLTLDDVLGTSRIEQATVSPDGEWIAAVVQRPAGAGEVYGRTYYELDPGRHDIWLISRRTGAQRNLTRGSKDAAGFWCASWSPDGGKLAMLSTRPQGGEPRGGDNVRLYVWDRATGRLGRLGDDAVMTQTRGGAPMYRSGIRGGGSQAALVHRCNEGEAAPFVWLDERRLLAVTLPAGSVSGLLDAYSRPAAHTAETLRKLRHGTEPTVTTATSGVEGNDAPAARALIRHFDLRARSARTIAEVPVFPFRGELTISIAPDQRHVAILATVAGLPPAPHDKLEHRSETWYVQKRLGFAPVAGPGGVEWVTLPREAHLPQDLYGWSPDGRQISFRARAAPASKRTTLFTATREDLAVRPVAPALAVGSVHGGYGQFDEAVHWLDDRRLLARMSAVEGAPRADWWMATAGSEPLNLTKAIETPPDSLIRSASGRFYGLAGAALTVLDPQSGRFAPASVRLPPGATALRWPSSAATPADGISSRRRAQTGSSC